MEILSLQRWLAALGLLLWTAAAFGQQIAAEPPIDFRMRQADERLNTPVTLSADRMYLGELLEMLSAKTHVALSIDENDSFSGVPITCDLKQLSLAEAMNALVSLLGAKGAVWEWQTDSVPSAPLHYSLRPTPAARTLAERSRRRMQEALENMTNWVVSLASLSLEARKDPVEEYIAAIAKENPNYAKTYVITGLRQEEYWKGVRLFADVLSADQRRRVLQGEKIDIPLASMSEEDRQLALTLEGADNSNNWAGTFTPPTPLEALGFQTYSNFDFKVSSLEVFITLLGPGRGGGRSYMGVLKSGLLLNTLKDWILSGDLSADATETHLLTVLSAFRPEEIWTRAPLLDYNLAQVAATEDVSFLATLPDSTDTQMPSAVGKTAAQYFTEFGKAPLNLMHKWHSGVLLISHANAFYGDRGQYAYGVAKRLRSSLRQGGGRLSLADVTEAGIALTPMQLQNLSKEFYALRICGALKPICSFYRRYPDALDTQGVAVDSKMRALLQSFKILPAKLKANEPVTAIRILEDLIGRPQEKYYRYRPAVRDFETTLGRHLHRGTSLCAAEAGCTCSRGDRPEVE